MEAVLAPNGFFDSWSGDFDGGGSSGPTNPESLERDEIADLSLVIGICLGAGPGDFLVISTEDVPEHFFNWDVKWTGKGPEPKERFFWRRLGEICDKREKADTQTSLQMPEIDGVGASFTLYRWDGHMTYGGAPDDPNVLTVYCLDMEAEGGAPSILIVHRAPG